MKALKETTLQVSGKKKHSRVKDDQSIDKEQKIERRDCLLP